MKAILVAGARPNFMKIAPLYKAMLRHRGFQPVIVHTGQHYDYSMSSVFFNDLGLPQPSEFLGVGSGSHAEQTARVMLAFEPVVAKYRPDVVIVVGDVNSTLACALTAVKMGVRVAHVEAGLRSGDCTMPEEVNRIATDAISDYLFTPSRDADANLLAEGIDASRIYFVGNVMVDTLLEYREVARARSDILERCHVEPKSYAVVTLHRPSNVDTESSLRRMVDIVNATRRRLPVIWPVHPRTRHRLGTLGLWNEVIEEDVTLVEPLGYIDFLCLMDSARIVLTDSGGIQEETTVLGVPCLTLRENTERPITLTEGTNHLVGTEPTRVLRVVDDVLSQRMPSGKRLPEGWDGHAAERICVALQRF